MVSVRDGRKTLRVCECRATLSGWMCVQSPLLIPERLFNTHTKNRMWWWCFFHLEASSMVYCEYSDFSMDDVDERQLLTRQICDPNNLTSRLHMQTFLHIERNIFM